MPEDYTPPTLAQIKAQDVDVFCSCNRCHHNSVVSIDIFINALGPDCPFPEIRNYLKCSSCGANDVHARPNWKGLGIVTRHS